MAGLREEIVSTPQQLIELVEMGEGISILQPLEEFNQKPRVGYLSKSDSIIFLGSYNYTVISIVTSLQI